MTGWMVWAAALLLAVALPGSVWKPAPAPPFPTAALLPAFAAAGLLGLGAPLGALLLGPSAPRRRTLALLEAPPDFLWGGLVLALWPGAWGPPGIAAWVVAFLAAAGPGEIRWLCQALPAEAPFPAAWGKAATRRARWAGLLHLLPAWVGARLPLWLTGALVLERILGIAGPGGDWAARVAARDRAGLALWILGLAALWRLAHREAPR